MKYIYEKLKLRFIKIINKIIKSLIYIILICKELYQDKIEFFIIFENFN